MRITRWILIGMGVLAAAGLVYRLVTGRTKTGEEAAGLSGVTTQAA